ncbi:MAG: YicC/YloC family endoribonuclease, partial [Planctomycetota bacterium]|nr:YicC/YloC family endoribonuclease [Planctomycetota bacterium]
MTGFGSSSIEIEGMQYSVEIRSVNNKYFKAQVRLPDELLALETELESELARRIARGSVSVTIRRDGALSPESLSVDARMVEGVLSSLEAA